MSSSWKSIHLGFAPSFKYCSYKADLVDVVAGFIKAFGSSDTTEDNYTCSHLKTGSKN